MNLTYSATVLLAQSTLLLIGILAVTHRLRTRGPAATTLACKAGLIGIVALFAAPFIPVRRETAIIHVPAPSQAAMFQPANEVEIPATQPISPPPSSGAIQPKPTPVIGTTEVVSKPAASHAPVISVSTAVCWLWGMGSSLLIVWILWAQVSLALLRAASKRVEGGLAFDRLQRLAETRRLPMPDLRVHPKVGGPFLVGIFRPTILLSETAANEFDADTLDLVFEHELAHVQTRDCAWRLLERFTCALLWPQPLLWLLCKRLDQYSEELCDQVVIANNASRRQYADCLLALASGSQSRRTEQTLGVGVVPFRSAVGRRIAKIMDSSQRITTRLSTVTRFGISFTSALIALGTVAVVSGKVQTSSRANLRHSQDAFFAKGSDPVAEDIWLQMTQAYRDLKSLTATIKTTQQGNQSLYKIAYKRPGTSVIRAFDEDVMVEKWIMYIDYSQILTSTTLAWPKNPKLYKVTRDHNPHWVSSVAGSVALQHLLKIGLMAPSMLLTNLEPPIGAASGPLLVGKNSVVDGVPVVTLIKKDIDTRNGTTTSTTFSIGRDDHILHKIEQSGSTHGQQSDWSRSELFEDLRINPPISEKDLTFRKPKGAVEVPSKATLPPPSPEASALLDKVEDAYKNLKSIEFEAKSEKGRLIVSASKPNLSRAMVKMNLGWEGARLPISGERWSIHLLHLRPKSEDLPAKPRNSQKRWQVCRSRDSVGRVQKHDPKHRLGTRRLAEPTDLWRGKDWITECCRWRPC